MADSQSDDKRSDAQTYEAELKREIAGAKGLGKGDTAYEARLKTARSGTENNPAGRSRLERNTAIRAKTPGESVADLLTRLASGPLGFVQAGLSAAQNVAGFLSGLSKARRDATSIAREKKRREQSANTGTPSQPTAADGNQSSSEEPGAMNVSPPTDPLPAAPANPDNPGAVTGTNSPAATSSAPGGTAAAAAPADGAAATADTGNFAAVAQQTQALQDTGARMQTALEQNGLITNSLFQQTLALIESQNQKLGDVDRKISELAGQLKSLKNP